LVEVRVGEKNTAIYSEPIGSGRLVSVGQQTHKEGATKTQTSKANAPASLFKRH